MAQTKPSSLGPAKSWPNKRLLRAHPIDGHDTFRPSGDYDGRPPSLAVAVPDAVNSVAETKWVASACPPKLITDPETNPVPLTVMLKPPTPMLEGLSEVSVTAGLSTVTVAELDFVESATLVAVIVTVFGLGTIAGAK